MFATFTRRERLAVLLLALLSLAGGAGFAAVYWPLTFAGVRQTIQTHTPMERGPDGKWR